MMLSALCACSDALRLRNSIRHTLVIRATGYHATRKLQTEIPLQQELCRIGTPDENRRCANLKGCPMPNSRRGFLTSASLSLLGAATASRVLAQTSTEPPPGTPPAFGTGPLVGPEVSVNTFSEAEKLVQIQLNQNELDQAASSWRANMASLYERRTGPRKVALE